MTVLNDLQIIQELEKPHDVEHLIIHPLLDKNQIFGVKIDLRIDNELYRFKQGELVNIIVDSEIILNEIADRIICPYGHDLCITPGELLFAYTYEFIKMPKNMMGRFEARARLAKLGLIVSSGIIDPGFSDHLLLSFFNAGIFPIIIKPLMRVITITVEKIDPVKIDFYKRPKVRPQLDNDKLVVSIPDYDSEVLKTYKNIKSEWVIP